MIEMNAATLRMSHVQDLAATDSTWLGFLVFFVQNGRGGTTTPTVRGAALSVERRLDLAGFEVASNDNVCVRIDRRAPLPTTEPSWENFGGCDG